MRIVSRATLMTLPAGTVYSEYKSGLIFKGLFLKDDTCKGGDGDIDWFMCSLLDDFGGDSHTIDDDLTKLERGEDLPLMFGECFGRDGTFHDEDRFAVWSTDDMRGLARLLEKCADKISREDSP